MGAGSHRHAVRALIACAVLATSASGCETSSRVAPTARPNPPSIPAGFEPQAVAIRGGHRYWLLGTAPCRATRCSLILRTTDAGHTFTKTPAPRLPSTTGEPSLEFVDSRNGFAYVPGPGDAFFATHDGGTTWRRLAFGNVLALAAANGSAYAVTAHCSLDGCTRFRLRRWHLPSTSWTAAPLPFTPDGTVLDLAARGSGVWLLGTPAGNQAEHDELARSTDGGRTFTTALGPCYAGLGGRLVPVSGAIWAVCPTGNLGSAFRSSDAGTSWQHLATPTLVNSAQLAAASADTAVVFGNGAGSRLYRTTDGGATWYPARSPPRGTVVSWLGFGDAGTGYALVQTGWDAAAKTERQQLWRTTGGGARWRAVRLR
jgi:photosystem II stability/assembly factor-like uncharacterized protein